MIRLGTLAAAVVPLVVWTAPALGGKYNNVLNIGDQAPVWSDLEGVDGRRHSLADLADKQVVVVVFTCNSCPVATDYEDRIIAFAKKYAGSGGKVLRTAEQLAAVLDEVPVSVGQPVIRRLPLWSNVWVLSLLIGLLTVEWCWRRTLGLA